MDILEELRKKIAINDPDLMKNEDEFDGEPEVSLDSYQDKVNSAVDPEDLNFSMDNFDDDDEDLETEHYEVPQKDFDDNPIKVDDKVKKLASSSNKIGTVLTVGELIEVEWDENVTTLEYAEELVHAEDSEEEKEKLHSIDTIPPAVLQDEPMNI